MPRQLRLTTMHGGVMEFVSKFQADMDLYGQERGVEILLQHFDYSIAWAEFMRMAIYGGQPDLSELGNTWLPDFVAMNTLRAFRADEIRELGGVGRFVPALWHSASPNRQEVWGIPWLIDLSLVCYRRSWLAKAGIREEEAFDTPEHFERTIRQLKDAGVALPWVAPTRRSYVIIHSLAMWLWQADTDFVDASRNAVLINQPAARTALHAFLSLYRFIPSELKDLPEAQADALFISGQAAVTISGPWVITNVLATDFRDDLGLAIPLGHPYLGGSLLIIWKESAYADDAFRLICHLTDREFQSIFPSLAGLLPARSEALDAFPLPDREQYALVQKALQLGRTLPHISLWGMIEDRLVTSLSNILADIFAHPEADLEEITERHLTPTVRRLEVVLAQI